MKNIERKNKGKKTAENGIKKGILPRQIKWLIGIDEVGRGPLAGPVSVCACAIPFHKSPKESYKKFLKTYEKEIKSLRLPSLHMRDSKKLTASQRVQWKSFLDTQNTQKRHAYFAYATATAKEIDSRGIAMCIRALIQKNLENILKKHGATPDDTLVLLDGGLKAPDIFTNQQVIIKGDEKEMVISFASIYAKVTRDAYMTRMAKNSDFKKYKFEIHKGYGTALHRGLITEHGMSSLHRRSFCTRIHSSSSARTA